MAASTSEDNTPSSNQSFDEKHGSEVSVGRYARKQAYQQAVAWGGLLGGGFLGRAFGSKEAFGKLVDKLFSAENAEKIKILERIGFDNPMDMFGSAKPIEEAATTASKSKRFFTPMTIAGGLIGSMVASLILGYEHWRKVESQKIAVREINQDIANIKIKTRSDPQLIAENNRLRAMLAEEEQKTASLRSERPQNTLAAASVTPEETVAAPEANQARAHA